MHDTFKQAILLAALTAFGMLAGGVLYLAGFIQAANWTWAGAGLINFAATTIDVLQAIRRREVGIDLIALLSVGGSLALGQYLTAAVIGLMLAGGRALESYAERRAQREMSALLEKVPRRANRYQDDTVVEVDVDAIRPGDRLLVRTGETVPADGRLDSGTATVDESMLTGEPLPVERMRGQELQSGGINAGTPFDLMVTRAAGESALAGIVRLVESARRSKAPAARLADRFALLFVPLTLLIAGIAWLWSGDPIRALAVVVVATPCPLILAVPVAIVGAMSRCARRGVLVKHGGAVEKLAQARTLFFDKTGTLTGGRARLVRMACDPRYDEQQVLAFAASLDQMSDHATARAVVEAARERNLALSLPTAVKEMAGSGVEGIVAGRAVRIGTREFVTAGASPGWAERFAQRVAREGASGVWVSIDGQLAGALLMADEIRLDTPRALRLMRAAGIEHIVMATGDRRDVAETIGMAVGVDTVLAEQTPAAKLEAISAARKQGVTLMVGDGVNDAPALAAADVGIAMGARGAAAAAEAAQVVLLVDRIDRLAFALRISQRARRIALQSAITGMGLSIVAMFAAALGYLPPLVGALLQEGIDVAVILNALRVLRPGPAESQRHISDKHAAELTQEHAHLQPLLAQLRNLADSIGDEPIAQLRPALDQLIVDLRQKVVRHELQDDSALYPGLARMIGGEDPMAPLSHMHREIYRLVNTVEQLTADLSADDGDAEVLAELRRNLYALDAILRLHFSQEEELYQNLSE